MSDESGSQGDPESVEAPTQKNFVVQLFSNPWFGGIAGLCSIIGLFTTLYFAIPSTRQVVWLEVPARSPLFRVDENISGLTLKFDDKPIVEDVTSVQIAVWNAGGLAAKEENTLQEMTVTLPEDCTVIDARILRTTRDVVQGKVSKTKNSIAVSWRILEQHDAILLQFIYIGTPSAKINVDGIIEGQKEINNVTQTDFWPPFIVAVMFGFFGIGMATMAWAVLSAVRRMGWNRHFILMIAIISLCMAGVTLISFKNLTEAMNSMQPPSFITMADSE